MSENTKSPETFEEFRKSFFYGSRSDMSFKFLDHLSDEQGADFLQKLFRDVITSIDTGDTDLLKQTVLEGQAAAHAHPDTFSYSEGTFAPFTVNPADAKFTMLTSSGHYPAYNDPEPLGIKEMSQSEAERRIFDFLKEKPVLSEIPFSISPDELKVRHGGYDTRASLEDPNVTFPWQRMNELQEDGVIGRLTENGYSFIGACSQKRLMKDVIPEWIRLMKENGVDGAILIPV